MGKHRTIFYIFRSVMLLTLLSVVFGVQAQPPSSTGDFTYLYYFESDDVLLAGGESQSYAFTPLPRESVTLMLYGLDANASPQITLYDPDGAIIQQATATPNNPIVSIEYEAPITGLHRFVISQQGADESLVRVMLFEGDPLDTDLTFLDDLNPLLYGRAFMVAGGTEDDPLRTLVDVLPIPRVNETPRVFASRATMNSLPPDDERYNAIDYFVWFNDDNEAIYTVNIRPSPEPNAPQERIQNFVSFNGSNFFYFDYYFTVGNGSDPVQLVRGDECTAFPDRADCVLASATFGRTQPSIRDQLDVNDTLPISRAGDLEIIIPDDPTETCVFINGRCVPIGIFNNADEIIAGSDNDDVGPAGLCRGTSGNDIIFCLDGDDDFSAFAGNDFVDAGLGNDIVVGDTGNDVIYGNEGDDTLYGDDDNDLLFGEGGNDILEGGAGDDTLDGGAGDDTLDGGAGDDILVLSQGIDSLEGGAGNDTFSAANQNNPIDANLVTGIYTVTSDPTNNGTLSGIENILGSDSNDNLIGDGGANILVANDGNDVLVGNGGNDVLVANGGNNTLDGGGGDDTLSLFGTNNSVIAIGGVGRDTFDFESLTRGNFSLTNTLDDVLRFADYFATVSSTGTGINLNMGLTVISQPVTGGLSILLNNAADELIGSNRADNITGSNIADIITLGEGNDVALGEAGNDTIFGESGQDIILGGAGNDTLNGGDDFDELYGDAGNDTLNGDAGSDRLYGGDDSDTLNGGDGNDRLYGEAGNDTLNGDAGNDILEGGIGNDTLNGGADDDTLDGGTGTDILNGGDGNDQLNFGSGINNVALGGAGDDVIIIDQDQRSLPPIPPTFPWSCNSAGATGLNFSVARADGGTGDNIYRFVPGAFGCIDIAYIDDGASEFDSLDLSAYTGIITINLGDTGFQQIFPTEDLWIRLNGRIEGFIGGNLFNNITGTNGNDNLAGGLLADLISALAGNDILTGNGGDDNLDGGLGSDTANYDTAPGSVTINLNTQTSTGAAGNDTLTSIENAIGSNFNDTIYGDNNPNNLQGLNGNDTLFGSGGADTLNGGDGRDFVYGGNDDDTLILTPDGQNDYYLGESGIDLLDLSSSPFRYIVDLDFYGSYGRAYSPTAGVSTTDFIYTMENILGTDFNDQLAGNNDTNEIDGGDGDDTIAGGGGADILTGGAGDDTLFGEDGNDQLIGGAGNDNIDGGAGFDTVDFSAETGAVNVDLLTGTDGSGEFGQSVAPIAGTDTIRNVENIIGSNFGDTLFGASANEVLTGGNGNDTLNGRGGTDTLDGGAGNDTADYTTETAGVNASLTTNTATGASIGTDNFISIERIIGTAFNDNLTGDAIANILRGLAGDDTFVGTQGNDTLDGGADNDTVDYTAFNDGVTVDLAGGSASSPTLGNDTLISIENANTGNGDDTVTGTADANVFNTNDGNDTMFGSAGDDTFNAGASSFFVGDTVNYSATGDDVTVNLQAGTASSIAFGNDTLNSVENVVTGTGNDTVTVSSTPNNINTGAGNDTVFALLGFDTLDGGTGNDTLDYSGMINPISGSLETSSFIWGSASDDVFNFENVIGSSYSDDIFGSNGVNNVLEGRSGNDVLGGSTGDDTLDGGTGNDTADYAIVGASVNINLTTQTATGAGNDMLISIENARGGTGNDTITGDANVNDLRGNAGDDTFVATTGNDTLRGDAGSDTADYSGATNPITVDLTLASGNVVTTEFDTDTLISVENVIGGAGADSFTGDASDNTFTGNGGNDTFVASAGDDTFNGGADNDTVDYSAFNDGVAIDLNAGNASGVSSGNDTLISIENAIAGGGVDDLVASASDNVLQGGAGNDGYFFDDNTGNDTVIDVSGNDAFDFTAAAQDLTFEFASTGTSVQDTATAGTNSLVTTTSAIEYFTGGSGDDTFTINEATFAPNVGIDGGLGNNTLDATLYAEGVILNFDALNLRDRVTSALIINDISNIANVLGVTGGTVESLVIGTTLANNINITGANQGNFAGTSFTDFADYDSDAGDDTFIFSDGASVTGTVDGGANSDTLNYSAYTSAVNVDLTANTATGTGGIVSIENAIGGNQGDTLIGNAGENILSGGAGADTIDGRAGDDILDGGPGNDTFVMSATSGNDAIDGGGGLNDTLDYSSRTDAIAVNLSLASGTNITTGGLSNVENVIGGSNDDTFTGDGNANQLTGNAGDDTFVGSGGADTIDGGADNDTVDYSSFAGGISVNLATGATTGVGGDTLANIENAIGGDGNDTFTGDTNDNTFTGGLGDDTYIFDVNPGNDTINDAGGSDTFSFDPVLNDLAFSIDNTSATITGTGINITTTGAIENFTGGDGNDSFSLENGVTLDTLDGDLGTNTLTLASYGQAVALDITTGALTQRLSATSILTSYSNIDSVTGYQSGANFSLITGTTGADTFNITGNGAGTVGALSFSQFRDVDADAGNDTIAMTASGSLNNAEGGTGTDTLDYSAFATNVVVNLTTGNATNIATISNIENAIGGTGNDSFTGEANNNAFTGNDGNDTFFGTAGADTLDGGADIDTVNYSTFGTDVTVDLGAGTTTGVGGDTLTSIENVTTGAGNDTLIADDQDNALNGGTGDDTYIFEDNTDTDTVTDSAGDDTFQFDTSVDLTFTLDSTPTVTGTDVNVSSTGTIERFIGGTGADTFEMTTGFSPTEINGDTNVDTLDYSAFASNIAVNLNAGTATNITILSNVENAIGGSGNDSFTGDGNANDFIGNGGNDTFIGSAGADTLDGGADTDTVDYSAFGTDVTVNLSTGTTTGVGGDMLTSIENATTGTGNDTLIAGAGDNVLNGGAGDDTYDLSFNTMTDTDSITDSAGNDTVSFSSASDALTFDLGATQSISGLGIVTITGDIENFIGGDGDDTFNMIVGASVGSLDGSFGTADLINYMAYGALVNIDLIAGTATGLSTTIANIESIDTGNFNDTVFVGDANVIRTFGGVDTVRVADGGMVADIQTGADTDTIRVGDGATVMNADGGGGTDTISFEDTNGGVTVDLNAGTASGDATVSNISNVENVTGGTGNDTITGDANANTLNGGAGADVLNGDLGDDTLNGGAGADVLDGDLGNDTINGDAGDDTIVGSAGNDTIDGGTDDDTLDYSASANPVDVTVNGTGTDGLNGTATGADIDTDNFANIENINGTAGADFFRFSGILNGFITLDTTADDTLDFTGLTMSSGVTFDMNNTGVQNVATDGGNTLQIQITNAINNFIGSAQNDTVTGTAGNDTISTGAGDDTIAPGAGNDTVDAGADTDTVDYSTDTDGVTADLDADTATGTGIGSDTITDVENIITGSGADDVTGDAGDNVISTGAGDDTIAPGAGDDTVDGGADTDTVDYSTDTDGVTADLDADTATGTGIGSDTITDIENINTGSGADNVTGDAGDNVINTGAGSDAVDAGAGNDTINSGAGSDVVYGGAGDDVINGGTENDTLYGGSNNFANGTNLNDGVDTINGDDGNDVIYGGNNNLGGQSGDDAGDNIDGGDGNDAITGGNNNLGGGIGDDGADTIEGGAGDDYIVGGNENRTVGSTGNDLGDTITDTTGGDTDIIIGGNDNGFNGTGNDGADDIDVNDGDTNDTVIGGNLNNGSPGPNHDAQGTDAVAPDTIASDAGDAITNDNTPTSP